MKTAFYLHHLFNLRKGILILLRMAESSNIDDLNDEDLAKYEINRAGDVKVIPQAEAATDFLDLLMSCQVVQ